jgi:predicted homoserine dehydrogenase-like protein
VRRDQALTWDDVEFDRTTPLQAMRQEQDRLFASPRSGDAG